MDVQISIPPGRMAYTIIETASLTGLSKRTIATLIKRGELKAARIGKSIRIPKTAIEEFISSRITKSEIEEFVTSRLMTPPNPCSSV